MSGHSLLSGFNQPNYFNTDQTINTRGGKNTSLILKMCLLACFYNLSDRQFEVYVNDILPAKYFVGID